jgi:hypothetical protein
MRAAKLRSHLMLTPWRRPLADADAAIVSEQAVVGYVQGKLEGVCGLSAEQGLFDASAATWVHASVLTSSASDMPQLHQLFLSC